MIHHTIRFEGADRAFPCAEDDSLLRASLRAGIGFPYECNSGGCGACRFELVSGEVHDLWPGATGLTEVQRQRGMRLACQTQPRGECSIRLRSRGDRPGPQRIPVRGPARLIERIDLTHDMAEFCFAADWDADFLPGQYALLGLPGVEGSRAYSMSNLSNPDGVWKFIVKRVPKGRASNLLFDAIRVGDPVMLDGPYGFAFLRNDNARDIVCIAGGSGISPVLSILAGAVDPSIPPRKLTMFYGGRAPADLCVPSVIERDPNLRGRVHSITAISDPGHTEQWQGERGYIHDVVRRKLEEGGKAGACEYYFCGPPPMTDAVHRMLVVDLKVPVTQVHFDRFL